MKGLDDLLLIREGERSNVLYFLSFFILISAGMAIGRSTADALFLKRMGIEFLPVMYIIQSVLLSVVSMVYAAFADRIPAESFFRALFSILVLLIFASWLTMSMTTSTFAYPVYYLIYELASELLMVHAAFYMNQNMNTLQAKRLTPLVFAGAQVGTISGGMLLVVTAPVVGIQNMLLVWCSLLLVSSILIMARHRRHGRSANFRTQRKTHHILDECVEQIRQGINFTFTSSLLRASSLALFFMVVAFYIIGYSVNRVYTQTFATEEDLARFFGILTATTSAIALFLQLFVTSRIIRRFGIRTTNLIFPLTSIASLVVLIFNFSLIPALIGSLNKEAFMPAFRNTVRSMFFNVLPDYIQGRARAMSVALVLPLALMICGIMLVLIQHMENPAYFVAPGLLAACLYLFFNIKMNKAYVSTLITTLKERLFLPKRRMYSDLNGCDNEVMSEIMRGVSHPDTEVSMAFTKVLAASFPDKAVAIILECARNRGNAIADQYLKLLQPLDISGYIAVLHELANTGDAHLNNTITRLLLDKGDSHTVAASGKYLDSENPRLRATAIHACLHYSESGVTRDRVITAWHQLLGGSTACQMAALTIIPELSILANPEKQPLIALYRDIFTRLLNNPSEDTRIRCLNSMSHWHANISGALCDSITQSLVNENPALREAAASCLQLLDKEQRHTYLLQAIGDSHVRVREAGIKALKSTTDSYEDLALGWIGSNHGTLRAQQALLESLLKSGLPKSVFEDIAHTKTTEARLLQDAISILNIDAERDKNTAMSLLRYTLAEQMDQTMELALLALEPLYGTETIGIIRYGTRSGDPRHIANACEALGNLGDQKIISNLSDILQKSAAKDFHRENMKFQQADDVLNWCSRHTNDWLRYCSHKALYPDTT